jgi:hypothetical protein
MHGRAYHPQTQGKVERFHGTLEREVWPKARRDLLENFQADLERWRPVYNSIRPHEALGDEPPATRWAPSPRRRPDAVPEVSYPADVEVRAVGPDGAIRWHRSRIRVGVGPSGERVRVDDQGHQVEVYYGTHRARVIAAAQLRPGATA